jgi:hypothetical protein
MSIIATVQALITTAEAFCGAIASTPRQEVNLQCLVTKKIHAPPGIYRSHKLVGRGSRYSNKLYLDVFMHVQHPDLQGTEVTNIA